MHRVHHHQCLARELSLPTREVSPDLDDLVEWGAEHVLGSALRRLVQQRGKNQPHDARPVAQRRRRGKAEPHLLFWAMPSSIDQPLEVGVDGCVLESDPLRTVNCKERRAAGHQRRELCAQRPDAEEGPVDGEQPSRSQEEIAPERVLVAEDLG